jgi:hypothetical protein
LLSRRLEPSQPPRQLDGLLKVISDVLPLEEGTQPSLWSVGVYGCASRLCAEQDSTLRVLVSLAAFARFITTYDVSANMQFLTARRRLAAAGSLKKRLATTAA